MTGVVTRRGCGNGKCDAPPLSQRRDGQGRRWMDATGGCGGVKAEGRVPLSWARETLPSISPPRRGRVGASQHRPRGGGIGDEGGEKTFLLTAPPSPCSIPSQPASLP